jgi:hypothetical protein
MYGSISRRHVKDGKQQELDELMAAAIPQRSIARIPSQPRPSGKS